MILLALEVKRIILEKYNQAELLASFAEERIKGAEALLANGEEELALTKYEESTLEAEPTTEEPTKEVNGDVAQDQTLADTIRTELEAKIR